MTRQIDEQKATSQQIDDPRFWRKLTKFAEKAGKSVLEKALILYYVAKSEHVPKHVKAMIFGALTYFVSTIDAIPDFTPAIGFVDDLGILMGVIGAIAAWISPGIQSKVDRKLATFFRHSEEGADEPGSASSPPKLNDGE